VENDLEPNDLPANALGLQLNESVTGHIGYRKNGGAADAEDWYQFTTTEDGDIQLSLEVNGTDGQFAYYYLYDSNGTTYLSYNSGVPYDYGTAGAVTTTTNGLAAGTYYVNVDNGSGAVGYTLIASVIPPAESNDPEVNDVVASASPILTNVTTEGHINYRYNGGSGDDNDYYQITTHSSGNFSLSFDFGGTDGQYAYFYLYQSNGTTLINGSGQTYDYGTDGATFSDYGNLAAGTYYIRINDGSGAAGYKITNTFCPDEIVIEALGETVVCEGEYVTLSTPDNHLSYLWSNGATTSTINAVISDDYSLTIDNGNGCVRTSNSINIDITPAPSANIVADGATTICEGESVNLSVDFEADSYLWSNGETTASIDVTEGGEYFVTLVKNGCTGESQPILVTVNPIPIATITPQGATTFCEGGSVTLKAPNGNDSYLWSNGATTSSIVADASGDYSVTVTDNGCSATSSVVTVTENTLPVVSISADGPTALCEGESVNLTAAGASSYLWSNGATSASITVMVSGDYSVTGTTNGCSSVSNTISVTVTPCGGEVTIVADGATEFCEGGSVTLTSSEAEGNVWSNGETTQSIEVTESGNYSVMNNGDESNVISVTVNANPSPSISANGPTEFCEGGSVILSAEGMFTSYEWSNGETTASIEAAQSGNYSLMVTDDNGCAGSSNSIAVTSQPIPSISISPSGATDICAGKRVKLMASGTAGNYQWYVDGEELNSENAQTNEINAGRTGAYTCVVTEGICSAASNEIKVNVAGTLVRVKPLGPLDICEGELASMKAIAEIEDGTTYWWRKDGKLIAGASSKVYHATTGGNYQAVAFNGGCTSISNTVTVNIVCKNGQPITDAVNEVLTAWPNPTMDHSVIKFSSKEEGKTTLRVFNSAGVLMMAEEMVAVKGMNQHTLNMLSLSGGFYTLQLISADGYARNIQLVKTTE
jgi:hypothetical protein